MALSPYTCKLDPRTKSILTLYLFKDVKNIEEIRSNVISSAWKCAVIKPSLLLDPFQIVVAANKAVLAQKTQTMATRSVFTEIIFNLSITKSISQSLTRFGVEKDPEMLFCFLDELENIEDVVKQVNGEMCPISDLPKFRDMKSIKSFYKLTNVENQTESHLLDLIVTRISCKDFMSF